jgi:uncharacterized protein (DUF885 family)
MIETQRVFTSLSEEFVELFMKHHPVAATQAGIHDYDHLMPDDSPDGLRERSVWLRDLEQRLAAAVPWEELSLEARVDYALLRSRISALRADLEEIKAAQKRPAIYLMRAFHGVHLLLSRSFAPLDERKEAAVSRLMAIPEYLESAKANLDRVPPVYLRIALQMAAQGPGFVDDVVRQLLRQFPGEAERLEHAGSRARTGFLRFHDHLDKELRPKAEGSFAVGERWMNYKLEREHLLPYTCSELEKLGREHLAHTHVLLEEEARRVDPKRTWRELIAEGMGRAPEPNWLREAHVAEMERARQFVIDRHIVPVPPDAKLEVVDTPVFERPMTPYASYQPPAPFDADQTGFFHVTPIDLRRGKDEQARQLSGHCAPMLPIVALHEGYPGHHLQMCHANQAPTRLRRISSSEVFSEGWALYCEDLMWEQGFFTSDPLTRLFQLRTLLWRAHRVVIDVSLNSGRMTYEQAVAQLVDEVMLDPAMAASEVDRYVMTPTEPLSYLLGKIAIVELLNEARRRAGAGFDLHAFHAALLASGTIPPALIREELWDRLKVS